jgi:hypothetical protein
MHRNERFSADFLYRMQNLLQVLCPYLIQKYKEMPVETQELNRSLANFLKVSFMHKILAVLKFRDVVDGNQFIVVACTSFYIPHRCCCQQFRGF